MTPQQIQLLNRALVLLAAFLVGHGLLPATRTSEFVVVGEQLAGVLLGAFSLFLRARLQQHKVAAALELPEGSEPSELNDALTAKFSEQSMLGGLKKVLAHPTTQSVVREIVVSSAPDQVQTIIRRLEFIETGIGALSREGGIFAARLTEIERKVRGA